MAGSAVILALHGTGAAAPADEGGVRTVTSGALRLDGEGGTLGSCAGCVGPDGAVEFAAGGVAAFTFRCRDLGELTSATVTLEGHGRLGGAGASAAPPSPFAAASGSGGSLRWHLTSVEVTDLARGSTVTFPCRRWLEFPSDEHASLQQVLLPAPPPAALPSLPAIATCSRRSGGSGAGASHPGGLAAAQARVATASSSHLHSHPRHVASPRVLRYEVAVATSDLPNAGTDGEVWVELRGAVGSSGWTRLEASNDNVSATLAGRSGDNMGG